MNMLPWFSLSVLALIALALFVQWIREGRRSRIKTPLARLDGMEQRALEQRALAPEPTAPDIFAARLVTLMLASRVVFPWVRSPGSDVSYPPLSAIWQGTAEDLRATLLRRESRLSFGQRREIPATDALEHRLRTMARGTGRVRVELIGLGDRQLWRLTLNH